MNSWVLPLQRITTFQSSVRLASISAEIKQNELEADIPMSSSGLNDMYRQLQALP